MLGLVLVYFIGKYYYDLAKEHSKKPWPYAILGIVVYYGTSFLVGAVFGIIAVAMEGEYWLDDNELLLGLAALPFGILCCWLVYRYLKSTWEKSVPDVRSAVSKFGEVENDRNFEDRPQ